MTKESSLDGIMNISNEAVEDSKQVNRITVGKWELHTVMVS